MADYWKSQVRKFCDFCKCWIADNKPSVQFHESGKRHKENVAKKIAEITKKSTKAHKAEQQYQDDLKSMEDAAMKAYLKDIATSADYTAQKILEAKKQLEQEAVNEDGAETSTKPVEEVPEEPPAKEWYEAKSDEGHTYYWNITTSESIWEPPTEGYKSIKEQEVENKEKKRKLDVEKQKAKEAKKLKKEEDRARKQREEMKKRRVEPEPPKEEFSGVAYGPAPKVDPYGSWTTVKKVEEKPLELDLPQQEYVAINVPQLEEPEIKFKEKVITQLDSSEEISGFKKRKFNKSNMRQRLDTD